MKIAIDPDRLKHTHETLSLCYQVIIQMRNGDEYELTEPRHARGHLHIRAVTNRNTESALRHGVHPTGANTLYLKASDD